MSEVEQNSGERLKQLIAKHVLKRIYWGYLFSRIRRKPMTNFGSIMGVMPETDGTMTLIYEPDLLNKTDDKQILRILEHEGMHLLNKHIPRLLRIIANETSEMRKYGKSRIWNIAADCSVNVQANIRDPIVIDSKPFPPQLPSMYDLPEGKITEDYYLQLLKKVEKEAKEGKGNGNGKGEGKEGQGFGNKAFDDHKRWTENVSSVADISSLSRKLEHHVQGIIREATKNYKDRGNLPAHIAELIEEALKPPKAPYYQIIRKLVRGTRFSKFKVSPTRINRKRTYTFLIAEDLPEISPFPGKCRDMTFNIVVMIDTSGSMGTDDILEGLSGVKNIIEKDRYCLTTVLEVDCGVEKEYVVKKIRDIDFKVKGRGGTTLTPGLQRAKQLGCDVCLAFTDGFVEDINSVPRKELPKKIIWVLTPDGSVDNIDRTGYIVRI